jgi:alcohol dehydrogenase, propanol-preferring
MRCWSVVEHGQDLQEIEMEVPEPSGAQVLLEVTHCGVCHTDLHVWMGYYDLGEGKRSYLKDRGVKLPLAMGHEIVGRVVKMGPDATGVNVGDTRIVYPWVGCGQCRRCLAGQENLCSDGRAIGIFQNGGYASHVMAQTSRHLVDPGNLDPALAATYACSGITVFSAIKKVMPLQPGEPIVLIGAGGLGLSAIAVLRSMGHRAIISVDVSQGKLQAALDAGASHAVDSSTPGVADRILAAAQGPVIAILDFVNGSATAAFAVDVLSKTKGGRLVQVGLFGGEIKLALPVVAMRELTVGGSYVGTLQDLFELVALAQSGRLAPTIITTVPMEQANNALKRLDRGEVVGRIVLRSEQA